jgi:Domain of unknown function (DUF4832)/Domain of unknown function (DUF4874)
VRTYTSSLENFPNPERGFYQQEEPMGLGTARSALSADALTQLRKEGISTLRLYFLIDEFREGAISADALKFITDQFNTARGAGVKLIPRFAYNFPQGGSYPYKDPDATQSRVLAHIAQLEPVFKANADVIAYVEIGFIGAWGEWHSSTNNLVDPEPNTKVNDASRAIVKRLLEALPKTRMLAQRYPRYKQELFSKEALAMSEAFTGSDRSRVGAHNDCFLASNSDYGTYSDNATEQEATKAFLERDNLYLPQGGETCNNDANAQPYTGCQNALKDMTRLRYTSLNRGYLTDVYARWKNEGCLDEATRRLGYRFSLLESTLPESARPGSGLTIKLSVKNEGFAVPFNPRGFALVLRAKSDGKLTRLTITDGGSIPANRNLDPRFWTPGATTTLETTLALPNGLVTGPYDLLLHLYDPEPTLKDRPEYAIRLANADLWEASSGMNKIGSLEVRP